MQDFAFCRQFAVDFHDVYAYFCFMTRSTVLEGAFDSWYFCLLTVRPHSEDVLRVIALRTVGWCRAVSLTWSQYFSGGFNSLRSLSSVRVSVRSWGIWTLFFAPVSTRVWTRLEITFSCSVFLHNALFDSGFLYKRQDSLLLCVSVSPEEYRNIGFFWELRPACVRAWLQVSAIDTAVSKQTPFLHHRAISSSSSSSSLRTIC